MIKKRILTSIILALATLVTASAQAEGGVQTVSFEDLFRNKNCNTSPNNQEAALAVRDLLSTQDQLIASGASNMSVANVGSGEVCDFQWVEKALNLPRQSIAQFSSCGVVFHFLTIDELRNFARSYIQTQAERGVLQKIRNGAQIYVPLCAVVD